ncbi:MAG: DMT family transporter [Parvibaculaceae bacterium]
MQTRPALGILFALAAAGGYGFMPPLARVGFENGVPTWESALCRAVAILIAFSAVALSLRMPLKVPKGCWPALAVLSVSTLLVSLGYLASVEFIPVGLAVIIFYTYPVIVLLAAPVLEGQPLGLYRLAVACLAFGGLGIAIGPSLDSLDMRGILFALLAAFTAAAQLFSGRALSDRMQPLAFGLVAHLLIWPFMLAAALWWSGGTLQILPGGPVNATGYAAVLGLSVVFVGTYFLHMRSLSFAPASTVAPFFNLEPVTTMAVATLILGERLSPNQYAGGAIVLTALVLAGLEGYARRTWLARQA